MVSDVLSRLRSRGSLVIGLVVIAALGSFMAAVAQSDGGGDMLYACIDSRNGAIYGVQIDSDNVRCSRGDAQVSWGLGPPEPGPPGAPGEPGEPGQGGGGWFFAGTWQTNTLYFEGAVVEHEGSSYVSIVESQQNVEPPASGYWQVLALRGADGEDGRDGDPGEDGQRGEPGEQGPRGHTGQQGPFGLGFNWLGEFNPASPYSPNDVVFHDGSAWIAVADVPSSAPGEDADWDLFAQGGVETNDNGDDPNGNGGDGMAAVHHVEEVMSITSSDLSNGTALVSCPAHAPRIISGGYHLADSNGNHLSNPGNAYMSNPRGSGPEFVPGDRDGWRVSWGQISSASGGDAVVVHAFCVED